MISEVVIWTFLWSASQAAPTGGPENKLIVNHNEYYNFRPLTDFQPSHIETLHTRQRRSGLLNSGYSRVTVHESAGKYGPPHADPGAKQSSYMSVKDSLSLFMRENVYQAMPDNSASESSAHQHHEPMTAALRAPESDEGVESKDDDFSFLMKRKLSNFVKELMKAEIHGVRVETRENGKLRRDLTR